MTKAITWAAFSLKCDAQGCDHVEKVSAITAECIGKPCPKCGANLLTQEDHDAALILEATVDLINQTIGPVEAPADTASRPTMISINPHSGELNIKVSPSALNS